MTAGLTQALEIAKRAAREQWHRDLQVARDRYDKAIREAEDEYERQRMKRAA